MDPNRTTGEDAPARQEGNATATDTDASDTDKSLADAGADRRPSSDDGDLIPLKCESCDWLHYYRERVRGEDTKLKCPKCHGGGVTRLVEADRSLINAAETLIEEWRMAADDERGERKAHIAYRECAAELEHNLERVGDDLRTDGGLLTGGSDDAGTNRRPWRDAETLERLYIAEGLTTREIADRLGCTNGTVSQWLNHHDIPTRENWVAGVEAAKRANREERVAQRTLPSGYEYWTSKEGDDRTNRIVYVHRLLAVAEYGFDAVADTDIHHRNGVPWDNRPENIALLSKSDHGRHHANQRWHGGERA